MNKIALSVENLTKIYTKNKRINMSNKALNGLSFDVKQGEVFGLSPKQRVR
jgi:ABC-type oligopeptide transport system ATPase subunit